jgi:H+/Cl- antiporter ClcA
MKKYIKKNIFMIAGIIVGIIGGFLYWKFVGCTTGTCPLKSNPLLMSIYGALIGGLLGNVIQDIFKKKTVVEKK